MMLTETQGDAGPDVQPSQARSSTSYGAGGVQQRQESLPPTPTVTDRLHPAPSAAHPSSAAPVAAAPLVKHRTQPQEGASAGASARARSAAMPAQQQQPPLPDVAVRSGSPGPAPAFVTGPHRFRLRLLSFVRCVEQSSILRAALLSIELAGAHPLVCSNGGGQAGEEGTGVGKCAGRGGAAAACGAGSSLECVLAQLLALHLRSGSAEGALRRQPTCAPSPCPVPPPRTAFVRYSCCTLLGHCRTLLPNTAVS